MRIVRKVSVLMSAVLLTAGVGVCEAADTSTIKVAVVNVQQVLQQSPRVVSLSKKLETEFKGRQAKINDEQKVLQDKVDQFKKESPTMAQKERDNAQKKISAERSDLVKQVVVYQQDLQKKQGEIMQGILKDLNDIVSNIAKNQSYGLVLDSQAVIFAADGNDITKDVAKQFNAKS
jgi:outer membrane protein